MASGLIRGFVLRAVPVGDSDRIVDILTRERGLLTASVRGARRTRSPMLAATQEFALSDFNLLSTRGKLIATSAELVESFIGLQSDLTLLVCAAHLSEIFLDCLRHDTEQPDLYPLWAYAIHALLSKQQDPLLVTHVCGLRLMKLVGYEPRLDACVACGKGELPLWFSHADCGLVCARHLTEARSISAVSLSGGLLALLRHTMTAPIERLYAFKVDAAVADAFTTLSRRYVAERMEKSYTRLDLLDHTLPG